MPILDTLDLDFVILLAPSLLAIIHHTIICYTLIGSRALSQLHPDSISIMWLLNFHGSNLMNSELTSCALKAFIHRGLWHFPNPASGRKIYLTWDNTSSPLVSINPL